MVIERLNDKVNHYLTGLVLFFGQCESHGIPLPTLDEVDNKASQFNEARHYMYNEDDVDKVQCMWSVEARFYVTINQRLHFFPDYPRHFLLNYKNTTCTIILYILENIACNCASCNTVSIG